jgi:hypothetical protein
MGWVEIPGQLFVAYYVGLVVILVATGFLGMGWWYSRRRP